MGRQTPGSTAMELFSGNYRRVESAFPGRTAHRFILGSRVAQTNASVKRHEAARRSASVAFVWRTLRTAAFRLVQRHVGRMSSVGVHGGFHWHAQLAPAVRRAVGRRLNRWPDLGSHRRPSSGAARARHWVRVQEAAAGLDLPPGTRKQKGLCGLSDRGGFVRPEDDWRATAGSGRQPAAPRRPAE